MKVETHVLRPAIAAVTCLLLVLAGCLSSQSPAAPGAAPEVAQAGGGGAPLANFHRALAALQAGRAEHMTVLQIGDSHTAGDHFSGRLRELLQQRFGNGGRGMLPPGSPFPYFRPYQVQVKQEGKWEVMTSNRTDYVQVPYGLSGFVIRARNRGDAIRLTANSETTFDSVDISYFRQIGGGRIDVTVDGRYAGEIETRGPAWELDHKVFPVPTGSMTVELRPRGNGPVDIADWAVYRRERGVVLSSHGFGGAQVNIMDRWDSRHVQMQLRHMAPALIVLAFGTNEGFDSPGSHADYAAVFESRITQLRAMAPSASIVVVGPPDADRLPDYCGIRGGARESTACRPLAGPEIEGYSGLLARRDRRLCRWHPPAGLALIREAQQQVARRTGVLFWDWSSVQGGACGATRWAKDELGRQDRVHMFESGYGLSAEHLFDELMRGFRGR